MIQPEDIRAKVMRLWATGQLLREGLEPAGLFPWLIPAGAPTGRNIIEQFARVKEWIARLEAHAVEGYRVVYRDVAHQQLGAQKVPSHVIVETLEDALRLTGKQRDFNRFTALAEATEKDWSVLRPLLLKRPIDVLEQAAAWDMCLAVCGYFTSRPRPGLYLRQLDIPGVDTKFIESHVGILSEMLDLALSMSADDPAGQGKTIKSFIQRYGLLREPPLVRLRMLDEACSVSGLCDLTIPLVDFQRLNLPVRTVFITENKINGLSFPSFPSSAVIFGLGYGIDVVKTVEWLKDRKLYYWGDIDSHGFRILDQLRLSFPHVKSMLMDMQTLKSHLPLCVTEPEETRCTSPLHRLAPDENEVYMVLRDNRLGNRLRLEQERVAFGYVESFLKQVT